MLKRLLLGATACLLLGAPARADTTLKLVEVITSPERTETLKGIVDGFEKSHPGVHVEITSLAWGSAFREVRHDGVGRRHARRRRDAGPLAVALCGERAAREPRTLPRPSGTKPSGLNDRALEMGRYVGKTAYMLPYGFYLRALFYNKVLFKQAGIADPPKTMDEFAADAKKIATLPGKVGLLSSRRPRRPERLDDVRRDRSRLRCLLPRRWRLDPERTRLDQGIAVPGQSLQDRRSAEGQRQLGLQRDRGGLLLGHLRDARPGSGRLDRHSRTNEARGVRRHHHAERAHRAALIRRSAMRAGRCSPTRSRRTSIGS